MQERKHQPKQHVPATTSIKQTTKIIFISQGALQSEFVSPAIRSDFISKLSWKDQNKWHEEKRSTVKQSIRSYIVEFIGKPILRLIR